MDRMIRFLRAWGLLLVPLKGVGGVYKLIPPFVVTGLSTVAFAWGHVPAIVFVGAVLLSTYVALTAGMAWEKSSGPWFEVGELKVDDVSSEVKCFYVDITNGPEDAIVEGIVNPPEDWTGRQHLEFSWKGHWRGQKDNQSGKMRPGDKAQYGLLGIGKHAGSGNPTLFIFSNEGTPPVSRDIPLTEQGTTKITLVFNSRTEKGEKYQIKRVVRIAPDSDGQSYKVMKKPKNDWLVRAYRHARLFCRRSKHR